MRERESSSRSAGLMTGQSRADAIAGRRDVPEDQALDVSRGALDRGAAGLFQRTSTRRRDRDGRSTSDRASSSTPPRAISSPSCRPSAAGSTTTRADGIALTGRLSIPGHLRSSWRPTGEFVDGARRLAESPLCPWLLPARSRRAAVSHRESPECRARTQPEIPGEWRATAGRQLDLALHDDVEIALARDAMDRTPIGSHQRGWPWMLALRQQTQPVEIREAKDDVPGRTGGIERAFVGKKCQDRRASRRPLAAASTESTLATDRQDEHRHSPPAPPRDEPASFRTAARRDEALRGRPEIAAELEQEQDESADVNGGAVELRNADGSSHSTSRHKAMTEARTNNRQRPNHARHQTQARRHKPATIHPVTMRVLYVDQVNKCVCLWPARPLEAPCRPSWRQLDPMAASSPIADDELGRGLSPPPRQRLKSIRSIRAPDQCLGESLRPAITRLESGQLGFGCDHEYIRERNKCQAVLLQCRQGHVSALGLAARGNTLRFRSQAGGAERDAVDHDRPGPCIPAAEPLREGQLGRDRIGEPVVKKAEHVVVVTAGRGCAESSRPAPAGRMRRTASRSSSSRSVAINPGPRSVARQAGGGDDLPHK